MLLGMAGCAGLLFYLYRASDPIAKAGAVYLRSVPDVSEALGTPLTIDRSPMNWKVQLRNDQGDARIGYTLSGPKGSAEAVVWLVKAAGAWSAVGARLEQDGKKLIESGTPPRARLRDSLDWD